MWYFDDFEGNKRLADESPEGAWYEFVDTYSWLSAKNRFRNRFFKVRQEAGEFERCLDVGENRPDLPFYMFEFKVGALGRTCADA